MQEVRDYLEARIKVLNETLWNYRAMNPTINKWLSNFNDESEKIHALYLLSKFMYYGEIPIKNLLISLYRDLYRYPIIEEIRLINDHTLDKDIIEREFNEILVNTRFWGIGNSSESSGHLLYMFRQETGLSVNLFSEHFDNETQNCCNVIFIDDFCGSGSQVTKKTVVDKVKLLRDQNPNIKVSYLMLFATSHGIDVVRQKKIFDRVEAVIELDNTFKCFSEISRIYPKKINDLELDRIYTRNLCYKHGYKLVESIYKKEKMSDENIKKFSEFSALGWMDCQLLIGLSHNTPNNTLPIIWYDEDMISWSPIFKRYNKKYNTEV